MPKETKETKKFINPLLRSSQELAPRAVPETPVLPPHEEVEQEEVAKEEVEKPSAGQEQPGDNSAVVSDEQPEVSSEEQALPGDEDSLATAQAGPRRKRGVKAFETTHERITLWINKELKHDFEALADRSRLSKTALLNEAITELLKKYGER